MDRELLSDFKISIGEEKEFRLAIKEEMLNRLIEEGYRIVKIMEREVVPANPWTGRGGIDIYNEEIVKLEDIPKKWKSEIRKVKLHRVFLEGLEDCEL